MTLYWLAGLFATLLILALAGYAALLWRRVAQQQKARQQQQAERQQRLAGDLQIIAGCLLDEQMPWIEGCIRLKVLLDHYDASLSCSAPFAVLHTVHAEVADVPSHQAWKDLPSRERKAHEQRFRELELQHKIAVRQAVLRLQQQLAARA